MPPLYRLFGAGDMAAHAESVSRVRGGFAREAAAREDSVVTIEPKETDELLANPHMGWQTFHQFADEDKNLAGLPSASAYIRIY